MYNLRIYGGLASYPVIISNPSNQRGNDRYMTGGPSLLQSTKIRGFRWVPLRQQGEPMRSPLPKNRLSDPHDVVTPQLVYVSVPTFEAYQVDCFLYPYALCMPDVEESTCLKQPLLYRCKVFAIITAFFFIFGIGNTIKDHYPLVI